MTEGFKYQLQPYSGQATRHACPRCGKKRNFVRYIDVNGDYVGDDIGRCNSEISCGYHKTPSNNSIVVGGFTPQEQKKPTFLDSLDISLIKYQDNLYKFLISIYDEKNVKDIFDKYTVRTTNTRWKGSTVFYQEDVDGRYRTGKVILYDDKTGKRVKHPFSHIYWSHNGKDDFVLEQCLFGEHLLKSFHQNYGDIFLVESEKTCLIGSLEYPDDLWLATGGLSNLNSQKLKVLEGFDIQAIPDKGGYDIWKDKLEPIGITVNQVMEVNGNCEVGDDIADLILKNKYNE